MSRLPERLYVREVRDEEFPCDAFTTKPLPLGERAECETDGHYRCWECSRKDPEIVFDGRDGFSAATERGGLLE